MPVLLLARGDPEAKDLLRQAIEARYGLRPPAIESLRIDFKGRSRAKVGPITTWVPINVVAYFRFPKAMRWDFKVGKIGITLQSGIEAFDGENYHRTRGGGTPQLIDDPAQVDSIHGRLWTISALLLTPLSEHYIQLNAIDSNTFDAENTQIGNTVRVSLREDYTLAQVETTCVNPDSGNEQRFILKLSEELDAIDELMLPHKISAFWDDDAAYELEPVSAENNAEIADSVFTLENGT